MRLANATPLRCVSGRDDPRSSQWNGLIVRDEAGYAYPGVSLMERLGEPLHHVAARRHRQPLIWGIKKRGSDAL